jgi:hypothetical protein
LLDLIATSRLTGSPTVRAALIISLSLNVFLLSAFVMYGAWLESGDLGKLTRALVSLAAYVVSFGAATVVVWKIVSQLSSPSGSGRHE